MAKTTLSFTKGTNGAYESAVFQPNKTFNLQLAFTSADMYANRNKTHVQVLWGHNADGSDMSEAVMGGFDIASLNFGCDVNVTEDMPLYFKVISQICPSVATYLTA